MDDFNGVVALVTGGGSGIGRALAEALAREGAIIAVTDIDADNANTVAQGIVSAGGKARGYAHDVTDAAQWSSVVADINASLGPIDILCSNAGASGSRQKMDKIPADFIRWLLELNVLSSFHAVREVLPGMKQRNRGHIVFTGSMASVWTGGGGADYACTKHAVLGMADSLRNELADTDITVSLLCPAAVATDLIATSAQQAKRQAGVTLEAPDEKSMAHVIAATADTGGVISAEETARITIEGMRSGSFFIITHPKSGDRALRRNAELAAALKNSA